MTAISAAVGVSKSYGAVRVLRDVEYTVSGAGLHAILGPSGSGKTTLLNLLAGFDTPDAGTVTLAGEIVSSMRRGDRGRLRARSVGFVFQRFNLIPSLTVRQNITMPIAATGGQPDDPWIAELIDHLGLGNLQSRYPDEISGGQQQRTSIVRALAGRPAVVFADEPTGSLDRAAGEAVADTLEALAVAHRTPIVIVTHDDDLASRCPERAIVTDGRLVRDRSS